MADHHYRLNIRWTGNKGLGTSDYRAYGREHDISGAGKAHHIKGSSDPVFRGSKDTYNPEELLVAALASCHMLWFLHMCAESGVSVVTYDDHPEGTAKMRSDGTGDFAEVILHPHVTTAQPVSVDKLAELHHKAHEMCLIANSVKFPVRIEPS